MGHRIKIKDIAETLGVSTATVSRALNDSYEISRPLKIKIMEYAHRVGYKPDRTAVNLRRGTTSTIGLVIPSLSYNFNVRLIEGIEKVLIPNGYKLLIFQTMESYEREKEAVEYLLSMGVDGIIASISAGTHRLDHLKNVRSQGNPLVLVDRTNTSIDASQVMINHELGSYQAVRHLLETGCRTIAWIPGPIGLPLSESRQKGYEKALFEFGIPFDQQLICYCDFHADMGYEATRNMLQRNPEIDGIYAINDRIALGVMGAIHSLGKKIPEDISVVGFNNEPFDPLLNPSLTSVYQPAAGMGEAAGKLMLMHLKTKQFKPEIKIFKTTLIVRNSTARKYLQEID